MAKRQYEGAGARVPHAGDGPMVAQFWRKGKFLKVPCLDVQVAINPYYAEIICSTPEPQAQDLLFVISDDPDIEANMTQSNGNCCAYDGFLLRDSRGQTIETITIHDCRSVH